VKAAPNRERPDRRARYSADEAHRLQVNYHCRRGVPHFHACWVVGDDRRSDWAIQDSNLGPLPYQERADAGG